MASLVSSGVAVPVVDRTAIAYKRLVYFWLVCFGCHRVFAYPLALAQRTEAIAATHQDLQFLSDLLCSPVRRRGPNDKPFPFVYSALLHLQETCAIANV
jgi:hypothetical protein